MPFLKDLKIERIEGELAVALSKSYPKRVTGFVKIGEKKWFLPYKYIEQADKILNFETCPDDTWIITYPRSGKLFSFSYRIFIYFISGKKKYLICLLLVMIDFPFLHKIFNFIINSAIARIN